MTNRDLLLRPTLDEGFKVNFLRRLYLDSLNLLSNGNFETDGVGDPDFWANWTEVVGDGTLANETVDPYEGVNSAKMTSGTGGTYIYQLITVVSEKKHVFRFRTKGDGTYAGRYKIRDNDNSVDIVEVTTTGVIAEIYTPTVKGFTSPAGCTGVLILLYCPSAAGGVSYFDACKIHLLN